MFLKSPSGTLYNHDDIQTPEEAIRFVVTKENLPRTISWICEQNGKFVQETELLCAEATVQILPKNGLPGGKGGFGSLLRSIGAQIEKTTNHEAMRDLSGRRQRDVNNEQRLKNYVAGAAEREREAREKKEVKLEKLRRLAEGENKGRHDFSDPLYDKARSETEEKIHEAVEAALSAGGESNSVRPSSSKEGGSSECTSRATKRKDESDSGPAKKKPKGLWIGEGLDDLDDSDLTDSDISDNEEETDKVAAN